MWTMSSWETFKPLRSTEHSTWPLGAGVYNIDFVQGIETIVNWCRAHGVKIMFTFLDNWSTVDSKSAVRWQDMQTCNQELLFELILVVALKSSCTDSALSFRLLLGFVQRLCSGIGVHHNA